MSEYWVSRDKFYCKYCKIFIADDKPTRTLHDTGLRHKGNVDRYIREIYKRGERELKDAAEEALEVARMERAAHAAMGTSDAGAASTSAARPPLVAAPVSNDPFANYSTPEQLGYLETPPLPPTMEEQEREIKKVEGRIGTWERVVKPSRPRPDTISSASAFVKLEDGTIVGALADDEDALRLKQEKSDRMEERIDHRRFLQVKSNSTSAAVAAEEAEEADRSSKLMAIGGGIKLKRQRLTLREENEIREREETAVRIKKEREDEKEARDQARWANTKKDGGAGTSGWSEMDLKLEEEEDLFEFEDQEEPAEEERKVENDAKDDEKVDAKPVIKQEEGVSAKVGGFKKRKMMGSSAARKK